MHWTVNNDRLTYLRHNAFKKHTFSVFCLQRLQVCENYSELTETTFHLFNIVRAFTAARGLSSWWNLKYWIFWIFSNEWRNHFLYPKRLKICKMIIEWEKRNEKRRFIVFLASKQTLCRILFTWFVVHFFHYVR